ncbi:hypothetical protein [Chryseobacterium sp. MA9]|uniref:hypothetical protein n=1 Tax=Chryseobacterium sp. MA9 TaxID=2966625 RepID=UPI0021070A92|nr:hypothetical protein [Chryseobacterium sp. MA9]UTX48296.1 hypothetical protein KIK00_20740 [Chryseobacterium sp. MA9]
MKKETLISVILFTLFFSCESIKGPLEIKNECGSNEIILNYNSKEKYDHNEYKFLFRSGIKDTVKVEFDNEIIKKYIDTEENYEHNFNFFSIKGKKDSIVRLSIGTENYCFIINKRYYYYDFIRRDNKLYIYLDKLRNRSFE